MEKFHRQDSCLWWRMKSLALGWIFWLDLCAKPQTGELANFHPAAIVHLSVMLTKEQHLEIACWDVPATIICRGSLSCINGRRLIVDHGWNTPWPCKQNMRTLKGTFRTIKGSNHEQIVGVTKQLTWCCVWLPKESSDVMYLFRAPIHGKYLRTLPFKVPWLSGKYLSHKVMLQGSWNTNRSNARFYGEIS